MIDTQMPDADKIRQAWTTIVIHYLNGGDGMEEVEIIGKALAPKPQVSDEDRHRALAAFNELVNDANGTGEIDDGDYVLMEAHDVKTIRAALAQSQPPDGWNPTIDQLAASIVRRLWLYNRGAYDAPYYDRQMADAPGIKADISVVKDELKRAAAPKAKPPEQGQVQPIEGLDEAIRCVAQWPVYSDMPRHKVAWVNTVLEAARRYSELARGKGGV